MHKICGPSAHCWGKKTCFSPKGFYIQNCSFHTARRKTIDSQQAGMQLAHKESCIIIISWKQLGQELFVYQETTFSAARLRTTHSKNCLCYLFCRQQMNWGERRREEGKHNYSYRLHQMLPILQYLLLTSSWQTRAKFLGCFSSILWSSSCASHWPSISELWMKFFMLHYCISWFNS